MKYREGKRLDDIIGIDIYTPTSHKYKPTNISRKSILELSSYTRSGHSGVYGLNDLYVKVSSKTDKKQVKISKEDLKKDFENENFELDETKLDKASDAKALYYTQVCAKVYERFIEDGLFHPDTKVFVCKDDNQDYTLTFFMPKVEVNNDDIWGMDSVKRIQREQETYESVINRKLDGLKDKYDLHDVKDCFYDLKWNFNWGYDSFQDDVYSIDTDIVPGYKSLLNIAWRMGIR